MQAEHIDVVQPFGTQNIVWHDIPTLLGLHREEFWEIELEVGILDDGLVCAGRGLVWVDG